MRHAWHRPDIVCCVGGQRSDCVDVGSLYNAKDERSLLARFLRLCRGVEKKLAHKHGCNQRYSRPTNWVLPNHVERSSRWNFGPVKRSLTPSCHSGAALPPKREVQTNRVSLRIVELDVPEFS